MKKFIVLLSLILGPCFAYAGELYLGSYASIHFINNKEFNHIGDDKTTINPSLRYKTDDNISFMLFKDSIGDTVIGAGKSWLWGDKVKYGLSSGFYLINVENWENKKFHKFWIPIEKTGIVPLVGPELEIELFKKDRINIKNHNLFSIGGFISTGLFITIEF